MSANELTSEADVIEFVLTLLDPDKDVRSQYPNAGEARLYHSDMHSMTVLVPLPYLTHADVTTDDVAEELNEVAPPGTKCEVDIAPPRNDGN